MLRKLLQPVLSPITAPQNVRIQVVFDNIRLVPALSTAWGFSCVVSNGTRTVLFDTGSNGDMLLTNLRGLGIRPSQVDAVMISHLHADHLGGIDHFLQTNPAATVYAPASIALPLRRLAKDYGATIRGIARPQQLFAGIYSTGELGADLGEQALIVESTDGPVLITGCARAGIDVVAEAATRQLGRPLYLVLGGFHLREKEEPELLRVAARLKALGVQYLAPSHCTGEHATALLREAWGSHFLASGCGGDFSVGSAGTDADIGASRRCSPVNK